MVRLYRTFSNHIFTRKSRCVVYIYTCYGWFNRSEPPRTFMNRFNTEKARCVEVYHMRSKLWFDYTEPFRTTSSQGYQGVGYLYTTSGQLNCSELPRNFSNHFSAEKATYVQVSYMSLGWFDYTRPTNVQGYISLGLSSTFLDL